ncbi:MAG: CAP domain-containing protein [Rhodobacteraceae bacterium]|nr:CAP domain-containing protein [Paracoccaceae bacterium]
MLRIMGILAVLFLFAACTATPTDPSGQNVFRIDAADTNRIQNRHINAVNAIRQARGLQPVRFSSQLTSAARTHARDMAGQSRPWHFGSDGSTPIDRVVHTGYAGRMLAENISETFENDIRTLEAWLGDPLTRQGMLNPDARHIGFAWEQEPNGKIWWVQVFGS